MFLFTGNMVATDVAHRVNHILGVGAVVAVVVSQSFDTWPHVSFLVFECMCRMQETWLRWASLTV